MAQKLIVELTDDLSGGQADETVTFGLDGAVLEIDLSSGNAAKFREAMAPFVAAGRKVRSGNVVNIKHGRKAKIDREQSMAIREWVNKHLPGAVSSRGRVPEWASEAFDKQDPELIPGYVKPNVEAVAPNFSEGGTKIKVARKAPAKKATATKRAAAKAASV